MRVLKFFTILFLMGSFYVLSFFIGLFVYDEWKLKKIRTRLISQYSHWGLKVLGIEVQQSPSHPLISQNHFIVCNHLSYLDILILAAIHPCCFVTSREIQRTPVLGNLAEVGGCLFVDRQSKKNLELEITEITHALKTNSMWWSFLRRPAPVVMRCCAFVDLYLMLPSIVKLLL